MSIRSHVKRNARNALSGNIGKGFASIGLTAGIYVFFALLERFIYFVLQLPLFKEGQTGFLLGSSHTLNYEPLAMLVTGVIFVLYTFVTTPLSFGMQKWTYCLAREQKTNLMGIFDFYRSYSTFFKSYILKFHLFIRKAGWTLLSFLPAFLLTWLLVDVFEFGNSSISIMEFVLLLLTLVSYIIGILFTILANTRYFVAEYLWIENPSMRIMDVCQGSIQVMKGNRSALFTLHLTFMPLYLLNILVLPIFFTLPYMGVIKGIYANYYIEKSGYSLKQATTEITRQKGGGFLNGQLP